LIIARESKTDQYISTGITRENIVEVKNHSIEQSLNPVNWSIAHRSITIINNFIDGRQVKLDLADSMAAELVVPLFIGDQLLGALDLCSDIPDDFSPDTVNAFYSIAQNIATAIRNARIYNSEYINREIYEHLHQNVGRISANISLDNVFDLLFEELRRFIPWDASGIWLFQNSEKQNGIGLYQSTLRLAGYRFDEDMLNSGPQTLISGLAEFDERYAELTTGEEEILSIYPWFLEIINSNQPVVRENIVIKEPFGDILGISEEYSALGAPLLDGAGQALGLILMVNRKTGIYDGESVTRLKSFTNFTSIAIENTRIYTAAHDQAWVSTVLLQVAEATQSITNLDELLETVAGMLPGLIGVDACTIFLWDSSIEAFFPRASYGSDDDQTARLMALEVFKDTIPAFDLLKEKSNPIIISPETITEEISTQVFPNRDLREDLMILFPLISQNGLCGAILVDFTNSILFRDSSQEVWDEKYTLIEGTARQTAAAIENLQLIKSQEEEAYISIALLQVAQAVVSSKELNEILSSIVRITPILVGVKRCIIYLWDTRELAFHQSEHFGFSKTELAMLGQVIKSNEFPLIESIQDSRQIVYHSLSYDSSPVSWNEIVSGDYQYVNNLATEQENDISIKLDSRSLGTRERLLIGFPLSVKDEVLGVMLIEEEDPVRGTPSLHIREKRIEIVKGITQQAAIAIKNELLQQEAVKSERMERELQLAREIQMTFLPDKIPVFPGWDISADWQPARQVAGDFYDVIKLDGDRVGLVIADVADKGMPAALFMTLIRTLIRSAAKEKISPAAVLKQVNDLLLPDSKHGLFVTVFYGVFSLHTGDLVYANAGHNPPIVRKSNPEHLVELTRTCIALGIFDNIDVEEKHILMDPGELVLMYTDGITEAFSSTGEMYGTQRLLELVSNHTFTSCDDLLKSIEGSVAEFIRGNDLSDDMTLAAIYRKPG
jgi:serine phosphatase RsbU (regulator of sigma subunit)